MNGIPYTPVYGEFSLKDQSSRSAAFASEIEIVNRICQSGGKFIGEIVGKSEEDGKGFVLQIIAVSEFGAATDSLSAIGFPWDHQGLPFVIFLEAVADHMKIPQSAGRICLGFEGKNRHGSWSHTSQELGLGSGIAGGGQEHTVNP